MSLAEPDKKEAPKKDAKKIFKEASAAFEKGEFAKAWEGYNEVHEITKLPSMYYNMAKCSYELAQYEIAQKEYNLFLENIPSLKFGKEKEKQLTAEVTKALKDIQEKLKQKAEEGGEGATPPALQSPFADTETKTSGRCKSCLAFYTGAGVVTGAGLVTGAIAATSSLTLNALLKKQEDDGLDDEERAKFFAAAERVRIFGPVAGILGGAALLVGGLGVLQSKNYKKAKEEKAVEVALQPTGVSLSIKY